MPVPYPEDGDCLPYFFTYIREVDPATDVLEALAREGEETAAFFRGLSAAQAGHRYAPGKWSLRELAGHLADVERVFALRALWVARRDPSPQPGFDENQWAEASNADTRTVEDLADEVAAVRAASVALFRGFDDDAWTRTGHMTGHPVTLRSLPWIILGHERHHRRVIAERYL